MFFHDRAHRIVAREEREREIGTCVIRHATFVSPVRHRLPRTITIEHARMRARSHNIVKLRWVSRKK